jgi:DNA replication protein DnaC
MGSVGTGKTIMLRALRRYFEPLIPDGMLGTGEIIPGVMLGRAAVIAKFDEYMIESAIHAKMLLIDDFGVEPLVVKSYGTACTPLVDVLCERYERLKPTIISTNLDLEAIGEKYGERLHDRMREVYGSVAFNFKSFRQP